MKITINGVTITNIRRDFVLNDRLDEELDTGIIAFYSTVADEYPPLSVVAISIVDDNVVDHYYLVDSDQVQLINKIGTKIYLHTIGLIEPTKLLERYYIESVAFTQPTNQSLTRYTLGDMLSRIRDIVPLEEDIDDETSIFATTRKFNIDTALLNDFNTIKAPQFFFNNQNLFQVLAEIFKFRDSIPRIETYSSGLPLLTRTDFNKITEIIALNNNIVNIAKSNNSEYYVNKIEMNIENGITSVVETYPAARNYTTLLTESFIITTNDVEFVLPNPIYNLKSLKILLKYKDINLGFGEDKFTYIEKDITDIVFEEDAFNSLKIDDPTQQSKFGSLVYKKGDNKIKGFGVAFPQLWGLWTTTTLEYIHERPEIKFINNGNDQVIFEFGNIGSATLRGYMAFKCEYYPYITQRATIQKQAYTNNNDYALITNQSGRSIDIARLLTNGQSVVNRIGNGDLMAEKTIINYNDRFKVGQTTSDNYIVSNVETLVNGNYFKSKAVFTKNFNRLSSFVGVDRDIRQFEMPLEDEVNRNLKYEEYVVIDTSLNNSLRSSRWNANYISWLRSVFQNTQPIINTINGFLVTTKIFGKDYYDRIGEFYLHASKSYYKNGNIFHFKFLNSQVAYYYPIIELGDNIVEIISGGISQKNFVRYTYYSSTNNLNDLNNGRFDYMDVNLIDNGIYKAINEYCYPMANRDAAVNFMLITANANKYPNGLFFFLTTPTTDQFGVTSQYVYVRNSGGGNVRLVCIANPDQILLDLLHNKGTGSSQQVYLSEPYAPEFIKANRVFNTTGADERWLKTNYAAMKLTDLRVEKDPAEIISMTYQLQFVTKKPYIIVGETFSQNSPYMVSRAGLTVNQRQLHLYRSTERYREGESKAKGTKTTTAFSGFLTGSINDGFSVGVTSSLTGFNSWAIGDNDGNLYFAVNRTPINNIEPYVYFQFKNKL